MTPNSYQVSVIIPVYNGEQFLAEAVNCALSQTIAPLEVIVVDDGSTDGSAQIAKSFGARVRYIHKTNAGPASARNMGLKESLGNIIAFLDADDLWPVDKLQIQVECLENNPSVDIVMGHVQLITMSGEVNGSPFFEPFAEPWIVLTLGNAVFKASIFERVGLFDECLLYGEDVDWYLRAREIDVPLLVQDAVTQFYRRHKGNMTNKKDLQNQFLINAIRNSLQRRRKTGSNNPVMLAGLCKAGTE